MNHETLIQELARMGLKRSRFGFGKLVGEQLYFHKSQIPDALECAFGQSLAKALTIFNHIARQPFDVVRVNIKHDKPVLFVSCLDWYNADEPVIAEIWAVSDKVRQVPTPKTNRQIYHHKWMFYGSKPDKHVIHSMQRSLIWYPLREKGTVSRIGYSNFWTQWLKSKGLF